MKETKVILACDSPNCARAQPEDVIYTCLLCGGDFCVSHSYEYSVRAMSLKYKSIDLCPRACLSCWPRKAENDEALDTAFLALLRPAVEKAFREAFASVKLNVPIV